MKKRVLALKKTKKTTAKKAGVAGVRRPQSRPGAAPGAAMRIEEILVPVDFSEHSNEALDYAVAFARQFAARLTLLYVVDFEAPGATTDINVWKIQDAMRLNAGRQLAALVKKAFGSRTGADTLVRTGKPFHEIVDAARTLGADLIIIATRGQSGISRFLLGSTTERVVRHASCPVLVVREHEREFAGS